MLSSSRDWISETDTPCVTCSCVSWQKAEFFSPCSQWCARDQPQTAHPQRARTGGVVLLRRCRGTGQAAAETKDKLLGTFAQAGKCCQCTIEEPATEADIGKRSRRCKTKMRPVTWCHPLTGEAMVGATCCHTEPHRSGARVGRQRGTRRSCRVAAGSTSSPGGMALVEGSEPVMMAEGILETVRWVAVCGTRSRSRSQLKRAKRTR